MRTKGRRSRRKAHSRSKREHTAIPRCSGVVDIGLFPLFAQKSRMPRIRCQGMRVPDVSMGRAGTCNSYRPVGRQSRCSVRLDETNNLARAKPKALKVPRQSCCDWPHFAPQWSQRQRFHRIAREKWARRGRGRSPSRPLASLFTSGPDAAEELEHTLPFRRDARLRNGLVTHKKLVDGLTMTVAHHGCHIGHICRSELRWQAALPRNDSRRPSAGVLAFDQRLAVQRNFGTARLARRSPVGSAAALRVSRHWANESHGSIQSLTAHRGPEPRLQRPVLPVRIHFDNVKNTKGFAGANVNVAVVPDRLDGLAGPTLCDAAHGRGLDDRREEGQRRDRSNAHAHCQCPDYWPVTERQLMVRRSNDRAPIRSRDSVHL